jgi:hypothetical protein
VSSSPCMLSVLLPPCCPAPAFACDVALIRAWFCCPLLPPVVPPTRPAKSVSFGRPASVNWEIMQAHCTSFCL